MRAYFHDHEVPKCYTNLLHEDIDDSGIFFKLGFEKIWGLMFKDYVPKPKPEIKKTGIDNAKDEKLKDDKVEDVKLEDDKLED